MAMTLTTVPQKLGIVQIEIAPGTVAEIGIGMGTETVIAEETDPGTGPKTETDIGPAGPQEMMTPAPGDDTQGLAPGTARATANPKNQNPLLLLPQNGV